MEGEGPDVMGLHGNKDYEQRDGHINMWFVKAVENSRKIPLLSVSVLYKKKAEQEKVCKVC